MNENILQANKFVAAFDRLMYDIKAWYIHRPSMCSLKEIRT